MLDKDNSSEINLNLKMPSEDQDGSFSMRDLVLTIYNARKVFFTWCLIGLLLGVIAAVGYYVSQSGRGGSQAVPTDQAWDTSITLILGYPGAEFALFPNGAEFSLSSFYNPELWENALKSVGRDDITPADAIAEFGVTSHHMQRTGEDELPIEEGSQDQLLNTLFELTISSGGAVFEDAVTTEEFLQAFCEEYKNFIDSNYFFDGNIGLLFGQHLKEWDESGLDIIWDTFNFERNFREISSRYSAWAEYFEKLFNTAPLYRTPDGKSFYNIAQDLRSIRDNDIRQWLVKVNEDIYIRSIDRFRNEYQFQIDSMRLDRDYSMEIVNSYNDLMTSFQQKDTAHGAIVDEAVDILTSARYEANTAADLQRRINQMEYNIEMLENNETAIRAKSIEAEKALAVFIDELSTNRENLSVIIHDYYAQMNEDNAKNSVLFTTPVTVTTQSIEDPVAGVSMTRVLMLFIGLTFAGVAVGFCAAFVKKYLPERQGKPNL